MNLNQSMYDYLLSGKFSPSFTAIVFYHKKISFKKFIKEVNKVAASLNERGIVKGDSITIALPNIPSAVTLIYACSKIGVIANMVHPLVPAKQLIDYSNSTNSKLIFVLDKIVNDYMNEFASCNIKLVICQAQDYLNPVENLFFNLFTLKQRNNIKYSSNVLRFKKLRRTKTTVASIGLGDDIITVMHSGGTTDMPKSICLSNFNFNTVASNTIKVINKSQNEKCGYMLAVLPMFHAFGLGVCLHTVLANAIGVHLIPRYRPYQIVDILNRNNIQFIAGVPSMFKGLIEQESFNKLASSRLRFAFCGGDKLSADVKQKFDEVLKGKCTLDEGYGLTEVSGVFSVNTSLNNKQNSVGKPLGNYLIESFSLKSNKLLARGKSGQLCICSDTVMKGYLNDPQANEEAFIKYDNRLWFKTGDLGYVDKEGYVFFLQRIKRIIKVSGVPVYPSEVENVVNLIEGVSVCCALGIEDSKKSMVICIYVVALKNVDKDKLKLNIIDICNKNLNKWSVPRKIEYVDSIPLTMIGKADYRQLSEITNNTQSIQEKN